MNKYTTTFRAAALFALALLLVSPAGCGKTGDPSPRRATRSFVWQEVNVNPAGACLDIQAVMSGVYSNLESVQLEFADVADGDCPGCPFTAKEQVQVPDLNKSFNSTTGELRFSYCPRVQAPAYRLRLVGVNIYDTSRHAVSPVKYVEMPGQRR